MDKFFLRLLLAITHPEYDADDAFEEAGIVYIHDSEGLVKVGHYLDLIEAARKQSLEIKRLRKDFNAESNFQEWRRNSEGDF